MLVGLLFLVCIIQSAQGWGPVTHAVLSSQIHDCTCAKPSDPLCASQWEGSFLPDAFFFGEYLQGTTCVGFQEFHDLTFAGHQYLFSTTYPQAPDFNATSYALGYASHILSDLPGFAGGYLTLQGNWLNIWAVMGNVDNLIFKQTQCGIPQLTQLSPQLTQFISLASQNYHQINSNFKAITSDLAGTCIATWMNFVNRSISRTITQLADDQNLLVVNDPFQAKDYKTAQLNLDSVLGCSRKVINYWVHLMVNQQSTPEIATAQTYQYAASLIQNNTCGGPAAPVLFK